MAEKLIPATQLAEYVYCSQAWYLKLHGAQVSAETRNVQAQANAWHEEQGHSLAKGDSYRWAAYAATLLAVVCLPIPVNSATAKPGARKERLPLANRQSTLVTAVRQA